MNKVKENLPGLLFCSGATLAVYLLSFHVSMLKGVAGAIFCGVIIGNIFKINKNLTKGVKFCEKTVLSTGIALLGVELQLGVLLKMGPWVLVVAFSVVMISVSSGYIFGRVLGFSKKLSLLLGTGNGVCGSSAIAALAPAIDAEQEDVGLSIGAVNLLGTIGILFIPFLAIQLGLNELHSSVLTGGSLQAVGQVAAAGFAMSENIGKCALIVKMSRVLMIVPVVLIVPAVFKFRESITVKSGRKVFPLYIAGFIFFSILGTLIGVESDFSYMVKTAGKIFMMIAMFAIGMNIQIRKIIKAAPKALLTVVIISFIQIVFLLFVIYSGLIG